MTSLPTCPTCGKQIPRGDRFCSSCGTAVTAEDDPPREIDRATVWDGIFDRLKGAVAPKYRLIRLLGYGGMAGVYLAEEPRLGRKVAIKVMSPGLMVDPGMVRRFEQEARTIAQLNHSNIITIYEVDERDDFHYFVMTYVGGRSLAQVMEDPVPLPVEAVRHWLSQTGSALGYAHRAGVVHRDVKPGNILMHADGTVVVTDFGIAKVADEPGLTRTGMLVGTPAYMSPEQCTSGELSGASDQYALGAVAYQMLTGDPPFTGHTMAVMQAHMGREPAPLREHRPDCPEDLAEAIHRMLVKKPEERWPSMMDAVAALGARPLRHDDPLRTRLAGLAARVEGLVVSTPGGVERPPAESPTMTLGESLELDAVAHDGSGAVLRDRRVEWESADPEVATVDPDGRVRALAPGRVRIVGWCEGLKDSVVLEVVPPPVEHVEIEPPSTSIERGETVRLVPRARRRGGAYVDAPAVVWSTSDPAIAVVSPHGVVRALEPGEATITATVEGRSATTSLVITAPHPIPAPPEPEIPPGTKTSPDPDATPAMETEPGEAVAEEDGEAAPDRGAEVTSPRADGPDTPPPTVRPTGRRERWVPTVGPLTRGAAGGSEEPETPPPLFDEVEPDESARATVVAGPEVRDRLRDRTPGGADRPPDTPTEPPPATPGPRPWETPEGRRWLAIGAGVVLLLLGGLGVAAIVQAVRDDGAPADPASLEVPGPAGDPFAEGDPGVEDEPLEDAPSGDPSADAPVAEPPAERPRPVQDPRPTPDPPTPTRPEPAAEERPAPTPPAPGTLRLTGSLPPGLRVRAVGSDGRAIPIGGASASLPPGTYRLEAEAPGYQAASTRLQVPAGGTVSWSPSLAPVPAPEPAAEPAYEPEPEVADPAPDPATDAAAVRSAVESFVAALDGRNAGAVVPLLPADARSAWDALLRHPGVSDWSARLVEAPPPAVSGDRATASFVVGLSYRDPNAGDVSQRIRYEATAERSGPGWRLVDVRTPR